MSEGITIGNRIEVSPATLGLLVGDVVAILLFVVAGELRHGVALTPGTVLTTAAPFLVGWVLAAAFFGLFATAMLRNARETVLRVAGAWLVADVIATGLRVGVFGERFAVTFFLVALVVGGALLAVWRVASVRFLR